MTTIVHLSTVHPRFDIRIFVKQAQTTAASLPHKVILVVADGKGDMKDQPGRVSIVDIGNAHGNFLRRVFLGFLWAFRAIRRIRPEVVHFHDPELIPLGILLKVFGYIVIYDVHEDVPGQALTKYWLPQRIRKFVAWLIYVTEGLGAMVFDAIVPATPKIAEHFPAQKSVIVQNYPIADELLPRKRIPYCERPPAFIYPGVIADIRGGVEMVQSIELLSHVPGVRLDLAGVFSPESFTAVLQALPGWQRVVYHGEVSREQLAHLLGNVRAGLVVHHPIPNEVDAQPIKMYEYMSVGLPIIASDFPLWRQIISDAECGLLVNPLNPAEIAEAMRWILDNPEEAEAMGQRDRQAVDTQYNWNVEVAKLIALDNKLL